MCNRSCGNCPSKCGSERKTIDISGLTDGEINTIKRLFEQHVTLQYSGVLPLNFDRDQWDLFQMFQNDNKYTVNMRNVDTGEFLVFNFKI